PYASAFKAQSAMGRVAWRPPFPEALRGQTAVTVKYRRPERSGCRPATRKLYGRGSVEQGFRAIWWQSWKMPRSPATRGVAKGVRHCRLCSRPARDGLRVLDRKSVV